MTSSVCGPYRDRKLVQRDAGALRVRGNSGYPELSGGSRHAYTAHRSKEGILGA